jgi:hypothetical protein
VTWTIQWLWDKMGFPSIRWHLLVDIGRWFEWANNIGTRWAFFIQKRRIFIKPLAKGATSSSAFWDPSCLGIFLLSSSLLKKTLLFCSHRYPWFSFFKIARQRPWAQTEHNH